MEGASSRARSRCDDPSSDRTLRVAAFSRKGCDSETRGSRWRPKGEKGEEDRRCAWAHAPNPAVFSGRDVQCHFVPGVATPSVFDPQLPRLRAVPQSEHTLATRSRPPSRSTEINDPVCHRA